MGSLIPFLFVSLFFLVCHLRRNHGQEHQLIFPTRRKITRLFRNFTLNNRLCKDEQQDCCDYFAFSKKQSLNKRRDSLRETGQSKFGKDFSIFSLKKILL